MCCSTEYVNSTSLVPALAGVGSLSWLWVVVCTVTTGGYKSTLFGKWSSQSQLAIREYTPQNNT